MKQFALLALLGATSAVSLERHHHHHHEYVETPADSRKAWEETRDASRAAAAEQLRFQAEHNKMVADNFAADTKE